MASAPDDSFAREVGPLDQRGHQHVQIGDDVRIGDDAEVDAALHGRDGYVVKDVTDEGAETRKFHVKLYRPVYSAAGRKKVRIQSASIDERSLMRMPLDFPYYDNLPPELQANVISQMG